MHLRSDQYLSIFCLVLVILLSGISARASALEQPNEVLLIQKPELVVPVLRESVVPPQISATAAIVIDENSAVTLFEQNADYQFPPASTTKLMTALLARSLYLLDTALTVPQLVTALDGTSAGLIAGEKLSVSSLLKAALMQSGNDAALTLAAAHPEGVDGFVAAMNAYALKLHLNSSSFKNPIGYDAPDHVASSRDLALLAREVMKDPVLRAIVGTTNEVITDTTGAVQHELSTTHKLLGVDPTVIGIKTGTTEEAGEVLITQFKHADQSILVVVMGSKDRYSDTRALMEYVRQAVEWKTVRSTDPLDITTAQ